MNNRQVDVGVFVIGAVTLLLTVLVGMSNSWKEAVVILIVAAIGFWLCVRYGWIITIGELMIKVHKLPTFLVMFVSNAIALGLLIGFGRSLTGSIGLAILAVSGLYGLYRLVGNPPIDVTARLVGLAGVLFVIGTSLIAFWALGRDTQGNREYSRLKAIALRRRDFFDVGS